MTPSKIAAWDLINHPKPCHPSCHPSCMSLGTQKSSRYITSLLPFFSQALLESAAAQPSERTGTSRDGDGDAAEHQIRALSKAAVDLAVKTRVLGSGSRDGGDESGGGGGCVSEGVVREEVDVAIGKLMADGTGMRDHANAALGGKVVRRRGVVVR